MSSFCDKFDIKQTTTAAQSAHQNGRCERNHALVDRMMDKMCTADPTLSPEMALKHSIMAHNTLRSNKGFSPCQMVFNQNPNLPTVLTSGPPGLEEVKLTAKVAKNLATMQAAKEAFIQCEADRTIAETLRARLYVSEGQKVEPGTWVYYKQHGRLWKGPVKIHSVDGKRLYAVRGGKLQCINRDDVILSRFEEQMIKEGTSFTRIPVEQDILPRNGPTQENGDGQVVIDNLETGEKSGEEVSSTQLGPTGPAQDSSSTTAPAPVSPGPVRTSRPSDLQTSIQTEEPVSGEEDNPAFDVQENSLESAPHDTAQVASSEQVHPANNVQESTPESAPCETEQVDTSKASSLPEKRIQLVQCKECANVLDLKSIVAHNRTTHSITGKGRNLSIPASEEAIQLYEERKQEKSKPKEKPVVLKPQEVIAVQDGENTRLYEIINRAGKANSKIGKIKDAWFVRNIITGSERKLHTTGLQVSVVIES
jgi:hypothetical protein